MAQPPTPDARPNAEKRRPSIYWLLATLVLPPLRVLMKQRITGKENLPTTGPFLLVPNHYSEIDPVVVAVAVWKSGRIPRFMAKASLFRIPVVGWLLAKAGQIPVEREGSTRGNDPVGAAARLVEHGQGVIVYPEGTLTRDPGLWPMRGKTGAARIALHHDIPVIPVVHWGTQKVMPRYSKKISFFPPKNVEIRFGEPIDLSRFRGGEKSSSVLQAATEEIMTAITALLADVRGETAPLERWNPQKHNQKETGRFDT